MSLFARLFAASVAAALVLMALTAVSAAGQRSTQPTPPTQQPKVQTPSPRPSPHPPFPLPDTATALPPDNTIPPAPTPASSDNQNAVPSVTSTNNGTTGTSNQGGTAPPSADCVIPAWLADESAHVDDAVIRLHKLRKLDTANYTKTAPANCPQRLFKYRVGILSEIVAVMEGR